MKRDAFKGTLALKNQRRENMKKRIFLAGDSTMKHNRINTYPQTGWGQVFNLYLSPDVEIYNHAENGRSSKSFFNEQRLMQIDQQLQEGDFFLIQFGHNDQKSEDPERYTEAYTTYKEHLTKYIEVAKAHKAHPVLLTSIYRRHFDENGVLKENVHGDYPAAMIELAKELDVPVIDICGKSKALLSGIGEEDTLPLFMNFKEGLYANYPNGLEDNTHLRYEGAVQMAALVAEGFRELGGIYEALLFKVD